MDEKTIFLKTFGDSPIIKILDFLVLNEDFDQSMTDIAKQSGVGYSTLKLLWRDLEEKNLVTQTRVIGKAKMFTLNLKNPIIQKFKNFYWEITKCEVRKTLSETIEVKNL